MTWPATVPQWCPLSTPTPGGNHIPIATTDTIPETLPVTEEGPIWVIDGVERGFGPTACQRCGLVYMREATEIP